MLLIGNWPEPLRLTLNASMRKKASLPACQSSSDWCYNERKSFVVGIMLVFHSKAVAEGTKELAGQMTQGTVRIAAAVPPPRVILEPALT